MRKSKTFGQEIIDALKDFNRTLARGESIESKYTVHTYEIPSPTPFKPSDIKARRRSQLSMMPEDLVNHMTEQQLVDLLAYLTTLK